MSLEAEYEKIIMVQFNVILGELGIAPLWICRNDSRYKAPIQVSRRLIDVPRLEGKALFLNGRLTGQSSNLCKITKVKKVIKNINTTNKVEVILTVPDAPKRLSSPINKSKLSLVDLRSTHLLDQTTISKQDRISAQLVPGAAAEIEPVSQLDWKALKIRVENCTLCHLYKQRTNTVFGAGDKIADWMLVGEAPGEFEDKQGKPFVGQSGKLLDNMLRALQLSRSDNLYIANVLKCRPPGNRNPESHEVMKCESYLKRQVSLLNPKVIVALGRFAAHSLLKTNASMVSLRGRLHEYEGVPVIVTYHPAYLLRSLEDKHKAWSDLCLARSAYLKQTNR
ncbi:uracil-DNA glycosylase [Candidatus Vallotia tarda]|uniref:uracil-DNA glycosylase n=1 Tax=Candidatus Vallotiella hemipterorum TaxID=1177213 RepID=UPI001FE2F9C7|nr:uracil-DNA glycosylase [Candidatus Vallotia tarda]